MAIDSWMDPKEVGDLAAHASAMIDAALVGTDLARDAYWAAVRKGYNTPYNDPPRRKTGAAETIPVASPATIPVVLSEALPAAVAPAVIAAELRAG